MNLPTQPLFKPKQVENHIPYSLQEVKRQINYYEKTCGNYQFAGALRTYLHYLIRYEYGSMKQPPSYPNFYDYQNNVKEYNRPEMYQGASIFKYIHKKQQVHKPREEEEDKQEKMLEEFGEEIENNLS